MLQKYNFELIERQTLQVTAKTREEAEVIAAESDAWNHEVLKHVVTTTLITNPTDIVSAFEDDQRAEDEMRMRGSA